MAMKISEAAQLPAAFAQAHFPQRYEAAQRFRFEADRMRSMAAGTLLWYRFGDCESRLRKGEWGKPYLAQSDCHFNLSHSGEYAVLAVGDTALGVDIEKCTEKNLNVARRVFTAPEQAWMREDALPRFEALWTLKESVMKAVGKGMQLEPNTFEVLPLLEGEAIEIDGVKLYGFTNRYADYAVSLCAQKPIISLSIKEITAEDILKK